jgi:hypothetical protein
MTVTLSCRRKRLDDGTSEPLYTLTFSSLPGQKFGPFSFATMSRELRISTPQLSPSDVREMLLDAAVAGSVSVEVDS